MSGMVILLPGRRERPAPGLWPFALRLLLPELEVWLQLYRHHQLWELQVLLPELQVWQRQFFQRPERSGSRLFIKFTAVKIDTDSRHIDFQIGRRCDPDPTVAPFRKQFYHAAGSEEAIAWCGDIHA